jgi:hypothetical protein
VTALLGAIAAHGVRGVLVGSVAARAYGADVAPGDLDIVPALDRANLERLAGLLIEIEASIDGRIGHWRPQASGERKWIEVPETAAQHAARAAAWAPDPGDVATFDHLFRTRHGNFDTPPGICGTFEALARRARRGRVAGHAIDVAHPEDLLATLTAVRRARDPARVRMLEDALREGRAPGD